MGQFDAVAFDAREPNFKAVSLRTHGFDLNRLSWRFWCDHNRLRRKVERYPQYVRVFDVEPAILIEIIGLATQRAADDLLAE